MHRPRAIVLHLLPLLAVLLSLTGCSDSTATATDGSSVDQLSGKVSMRDVLWQYETEAPNTAAVLVSGGIVFAGSGDEHLYALTQDDGDVAWKFKTSGWINAAPILARDILIVCDERNLYGLDPITGREHWRTDFRPRIDSTPLFMGTTVIACNRAGYGSSVAGFEFDTGTKLWERTFEGGLPGGVETDGKLIYVAEWKSGEQGCLRAIDPETGEDVWKCDFPGGPSTSPCIAGGIACIADQNGKLHAIDLERHTSIWEYQCKARPFRDLGADAQHFYCGDQTGEVHALARDGSVAWKQSVGSAVNSKILVEDGRLYFGSMDGQIRALDATTGETQWNLDTGGMQNSRPVIAGGVLYFGTSNFQFAALRLR